MKSEKSTWLAFFLALFLGPIGLLYASPLAGVVTGVIAFVSFPTVIGPMVVWLVCMVLAPTLVSNHNDEVAEERSYRENMLDAVSSRNKQ